MQPRLFFPLMLLGVVMAVAGSSQVSFETSILDSSQYSSFRNCVVDMNGDHLDDVVRVTDGLINIYYQIRDEEGAFALERLCMDLEGLPHWSICAGDLDNNGFNDLVFGSQSSVSFIMANNNGTSFSEDNKPEYIFSQRSTMADINNDGWLDAFVCHDEDENHPYQNMGNGDMMLDYDLIKTPEDVPGNYVATWVDYDNDGDTDMYLTKCVAQAPPTDPARINLLYRNDGNGSYSEVGAQAGMDDLSQSWTTIFEDFDNDGDFDALIMNHDIGNRFMMNNGDGTFTDIIGQTGIRRDLLGTIEALAADFDNDGYIDIVTDVPNRIMWNKGNLTFDEEFITQKPASVGDLNNDGFMDFYADNRIQYNEGNSNHWTRINLIGRESNRNGIGARVEIYGAWGTQIREVRSTQSYSSMSTLGTHFGLGAHEVIDSIVVKWPSGIRSVLELPPIDEVVLIDEWDCPEVMVNLDTIGSPFLCADETVTLIAPAGYSTYQWNEGSEMGELQVGSNGHYNVTVTDANGCSYISSVVEVINTDEPLAVNYPFGLAFCDGASIVLEVDTDFDVLWSDGSSGSQLEVEETGEYFAQVTTSCGTTIVTDTVYAEAYVPEPPNHPDVMLDSTTTIFSVEVKCEDAITTYWYINEDDTAPFNVSSTAIFSNITSDTSFYVECLYLAPHGDICFSGRVPINIIAWKPPSMSTEEIEETVAVYPNPTTEKLYIEMSSGQEMSMILYDISGKPLNPNMQWRGTTCEIDVAPYRSGIYLLSLRSGDLIVTKRVVIME